MTYSQLMIAVHKSESENVEACDKVMARSAMTTDPVEGTMELGHQIAKLMATLTRAGQGNSPASTPNSPRQRGHGRGQIGRSTPGCPSSHNDWTCLGQTALACSTSVGCSTGTAISRGQGESTQGSKEGTANKRDPSSLQCYRYHSWGHMAQKCATLAKTLNQSGGTKGMQPNPPLAPAATANSGPQTFPPWPETKTNHNESGSKERMARVSLCPFPQPWPCCSLGETF